MVLITRTLQEIFIAISRNGTVEKYFLLFQNFHHLWFSIYRPTMSSH